MSVQYAKLQGVIEVFWQIRTTKFIPVWYVTYECSPPEKKFRAEKDLESVTLDGLFRPEHDFDVKRCRNFPASYDCST